MTVGQKYLPKRRNRKMRRKKRSRKEKEKRKEKRKKNIKLQLRQRKITLCQERTRKVGSEAEAIAWQTPPLPCQPPRSGAQLKKGASQE